MQFIDLRTQYSQLKEKIQKNVNTVLEHGQFILGPEVKQLESELQTFTKAEHALAVGSGSAALQVALMALEIGPGDEVITTPFTFFSSVSSILLVGAKPVLVDIEPTTLNIDPKKIAEKITKKTKAIIAVDLFGQCADYQMISAIAAEHGIKIIADAAQSFGAEQNGIKVGNFGDITTTSFYPAKPLGAYGEGGACFSNDAELAHKMRQIHNHGQEVTYDHQCLGFNARMDSLQAAILLAKLSVYEQELKQRQVIASHYQNYLKDSAVSLPEIQSNNYSVYAMFTIQTNKREELREHLKQNAVPTAIHYPKPVHLQPALQHLGYKAGDLPNSERAAKKVLSLPMHPYLLESDVIKVSNLIKNFLKQTCPSEI